ncbi:MAG: LysM peptidoglycan-binding domain-containing protein, partial [Pseudomonadota bacterium]
MLELRKRSWIWTAALAAAWLAGCASGSRAPAPVEDRGTGNRAPAVAVEQVRPAPGAENAGKPGFYTVRPGDTLIRIALDNGHNWRDVARWNKDPELMEFIPPITIDSPDLIAQTCWERAAGGGGWYNRAG